MTLALIVSLVFVVAGGILLVVGGTLATAVAMSLLGFACVIWVSLAFFAVGRSEDREREAARAAAEARAAAAAEPAPEPHAERPAHDHKDERTEHRFRRRPS